MIGKIVSNKIIIEDSKQARRLYNKSKIGRPLSGGQLEVSLVEGLFLVKEKKLTVIQEEKKIDYNTLFEIAVKNNPRCHLLYLVYSDLRERGYVFEEMRKDRLFDFKGQYKDEKAGKTIEKTCYVSVFTENRHLTLETLEELTARALSGKKDLIWFAVVDEEGDITYYEIDPVIFKGNLVSASIPSVSGILTGDRIVVVDKQAGTALFKNEFLGKPFNNGLQLSLIEAAYLMEKKQLSVTKENNEKISLRQLKEKARRLQPGFDVLFKVYKDLKKQGMVIKTGFKYGSHFRAYTKNPHEHHAEYLVDIKPMKEKSAEKWSTISRAVRLAHSVNKSMVFALVNEETRIKYLGIARVRP